MRSALVKMNFCIGELSNGWARGFFFLKLLYKMLTARPAAVFSAVCHTST